MNRQPAGRTRNSPAGLRRLPAEVRLAATSARAATFVVVHMSEVITMPPPCSSVLPFSRTVIVMTTSRVSKPLMVFFWPVCLTSRSISYSGSLAGSLRSRFSVASRFSCFDCLRSSSKVVTW